MNKPTDTGNERDLVAEANEIRQLQTMTIDTPKVNISFTSLAQCKIPHFSAQKLLGNRLNVTYVPDFYYLMEIAQKMFHSAKSDRSLNRVSHCTMYSFTLYIAYASMYVYLETVNQSNAPLMDLSLALNVFKSAGYNHINLPALFTHWINGLGKHIDMETQRIFVPKLPPIQDIGDYFDNHFYSPETAHLFPNFKLMITTILLSDLNRTPVIPVAFRSVRHRIGSPLSTVNHGQNTATMRQQSYRSPGITQLLTPASDPELMQILSQLIVRPDPADPLSRYLMLDSQLLTHLKSSMESLFFNIEFITIKEISPIGNSLCMTPLVHTNDQEDDIPEVKSPASKEAPDNIINYQSRPEYKSTIQTRMEVVNGNIDYATLTPIVRIANKATAVIINNYDFVDPQHSWYTNDVGFETPQFAMHEASSYFRRN